MSMTFVISAQTLKGDLNDDKRVNVADVTALIRHILTGEWPAETYTVNGISFTMIPVQGGTFMMGASDDDPEAYDNEKPAHQVSLSSYYIGQMEVTQLMWLAVMGTNPSNFTGDLYRPVEKVSWNDCQTFIAKLNEMTGMQFRLPTEAEWEFAARGGNLSKGYRYAGSNTIEDVAWYAYFADYMTHPVGQKAPNELGLYDMSGNVSEWCQDWFDTYSADAQIDPTGPPSGSNRVNRGGSWSINLGSWLGRVTGRSNRSQSTSTDYIGLRLAM